MSKTTDGVFIAVPMNVNSGRQTVKGDSLICSRQGVKQEGAYI